LNAITAGELEVVVVDDGSMDETSKECERIAIDDPRVRVVSQANAGKSAALRRAQAESRHEVLVFLDADTLFERTTIRRLVEQLADARIGAVSGNARVGNRRNFVTRCQALEYICGFNLDRRAYTAWNCVTVVPGAISAFRRKAIDEAGGFSRDTLAEDTDLTLMLHRIGWRIGFAPEAIAWTEAPETWRALARQRVRWAFGTMQCLWKHRDLTFDRRHPAVGFFSMPSAVVLPPDPCRHRAARGRNPALVARRRLRDGTLALLRSISNPRFPARPAGLRARGRTARTCLANSADAFCLPVAAGVGCLAFDAPGGSWSARRVGKT
jgi:cellulose synthase/poly-beta-1,6-N-acetylglucosamine synthase-like glycosyltransferase